MAHRLLATWPVTCDDASMRGPWAALAGPGIAPGNVRYRQFITDWESVMNATIGRWIYPAVDIGAQWGLARTLRLR
jgi:hypothetical protein